MCNKHEVWLLIQIGIAMKKEIDITQIPSSLHEVVLIPKRHFSFVSQKQCHIKFDNWRATPA